MRYLVQGIRTDVEVIGEEFSVEGSDRIFIVHRSVGNQMDVKLYAATDLETGFAIGRGDSINEAIEEGRKNWASKSPAHREDCIARAKKYIRDQRRDPFTDFFDPVEHPGTMYPKSN